MGRPLPPPLRAAGTRATALPRLRPSPTTPVRCFGGFATPPWAGKASVAGWKGEERAVPRRRSPPRAKAKKKKKKLARPPAPPPYLLDPLPALVHALEIGGQHVVLQDHVVKDVHPVDERLHAADALKKRARVVGQRRGRGRGRRASLGGRAHCFLNTQTPRGGGGTRWRGRGADPVRGAAVLSARQLRAGRSAGGTTLEGVRESKASERERGASAPRPAHWSKRREHQAPPRPRSLSLHPAHKKKWRPPPTPAGGGSPCGTPTPPRRRPCLPPPPLR